MTATFPKEQASWTAKSHARGLPAPLLDEIDEMDDIASVTKANYLNDVSHHFTWVILVNSGMLDANDDKRVSCTMYHVWAVGCQHRGRIASLAYALQHPRAEPVTVPGGRADLFTDILPADECAATIVDCKHKGMDCYDEVDLQGTRLRGNCWFGLDGSHIMAEVWPETPSTTVPSFPSSPGTSTVSIEALVERSDDFGSKRGVQTDKMDGIACVTEPTFLSEESSRLAWTVLVNSEVLDANDHKRVSCAMYHLWALGCQHLG